MQRLMAKKRTMGVAISSDLRERVYAAAALESRSVSNWACLAFERALSTSSGVISLVNPGMAYHEVTLTPKGPVE
jgi:hypothetical protein